MRKIVRVAAILAAFLLYGVASAADKYPDLRGTWSGKGKGVFATSLGPEGKPRYGSVSIKLVIETQKDRRFAGTITMSGATKPVVGVIAIGGAIWWSEPGGFVEGRLNDPNTFEGCYARVSVCGQLAACDELKRL